MTLSFICHDSGPDTASVVVSASPCLAVELTHRLAFKFQSSRCTLVLPLIQECLNANKQQSLKDTANSCRFKIGAAIA